MKQYDSLECCNDLTEAVKKLHIYDAQCESGTDTLLTRLIMEPRRNIFCVSLIARSYAKIFKEFKREREILYFCQRRRTSYDVNMALKCFNVIHLDDAL